MRSSTTWWVVTWWSLGGHLVVTWFVTWFVTWWSLGGHLVVTWWSLGGHLVVTWWSLGLVRYTERLANTPRINTTTSSWYVNTRLTPADKGSNRIHSRFRMTAPRPLDTGQSPSATGCWRPAAAADAAAAAAAKSCPEEHSLPIQMLNYVLS